MPIYEYQCEKCGDIFEVFQKISDPPPKSHDCGSRKIKRVMSQTSFQLKGEGWYITDYGNKDKEKKKKKKDSDSDTSSKSESKSSDKTSDTKGTKATRDAA